MSIRQKFEQDALASQLAHGGGGQEETKVAKEINSMIFLSIFSGLSIGWLYHQETSATNNAKA